MLLWWFNYKIIILNIVIIVNVVECLDRCNSDDGINEQYWSRERQKCLPCTICHDLRKITLLGCGPERDTQCGTIEDLKDNWLLSSLKNGDDITKRTSHTGNKKSNKEIFGQTRYTSPVRKNAPNNRRMGIHKVKESVKNDAITKNEFLKNLQELEQIEVRKKSKEEQEEVDGMIHFNENQFYKQDENNLHEDLRLIEKELLKEQETTTQTTLKARFPQHQTTIKSTHPTPPHLTEWFNGNEDVMEMLSTPPSNNVKESLEEDDFLGEKKFFATGSYVNNDPDVFGQVIEEPHANLRVNHPQQADEFGLLTQLLYRQNAQNQDTSVQNPSSSTMEDPHVISLRVEHVLVVLGICIGFGMVVCVAIVYFKVKPVRSFKMLNNNSARVTGDSASLSSGNSSFQQCDSRLTSLTASPLLSQAQSPLLPMQTASRMASPMQPSRLASPMQPTTRTTSPREDSNLLNIPDTRPMAIVDQRGRTVLKQSRELPV